MPLLRVHLLGGLTVSWDEQPLPPLPGAAARSLFAYLLTYRRPHTRDLLAGTFWPDLPDAVSRRRLSQALWQIRHFLRQAQDDTLCQALMVSLSNHHPILLTEGDTVQLNPDLPLWTDVEQFRQCPAPEAIAHYQGDFMAGYYDDWVLLERERLREAFLTMLTQLVDDHKSQGDYENALLYARRLATEDPLREEAQREVLRLYHLLGQDAEALKQFEVCRQALAGELGIEPAPETQALAAEIAARAGLAQAPLLPTAARPSPAPALQRPDRLALVGREAELAQLLRQVEAAVQGQGGLTLVYGEAGVGKTRLLQELARNAQWRGLQVAWGRCYELAAPPAYQPLLEALRAALPLPLEPLWRAELARLLPELATGEGLPPSLEPDEERRRLLEAIAQGFLALAAAAPGLALLEDAHWMDPTSLEALRYLLPRLGEAPLHVVLTVRSEDLAGQQRDLLTALENTRLPQRLDLARLDPAETAELVQRALDLAQPAPRFSARLYAETEGNPFFLIETLWALTDEGLLYRDQDGAWSTSWDESTSDYGELPLPSGVAQSIQRRLQRLPAPLGELLSLAAVIGRELDFDLWRQASQRDAEELLAAGDKLCARGLLLPADPGTGADYTFAHAQIRRVAYDQLAAPRRRLYHRRAAQALTQLAPDEPENLAHHWTQAEAWDKAADYHQLAGDRAGAVYANDEAVTHYTQALKALEWQARPMDPARAFDLLLAREKVHNLRGERAAQADDLTALETLAQQLDDDQRRAQVALRRARCAETTGNYPAACAAAQAAIELAQAAQDVHSEASGYLRWGRALLRQGDHQAAQARLARALALAQAAALDQAQADSLHSLGIGAYRYGDLADARAYFHRALDAYRKSGDRRGESASLNGLGVFASDQGDFEQAISFYEQSLLICREIGRRQGENSALNNLGLVAHRQEDYARASAFYQQSLLISREIGDRMCESNTLGNLGLTAQNQGDYARARVYNQQSLHICREIGDGLAESNALNNLGIIAYYLGDYVRARSYLEQALSVCREVGDRRAEGWGLSSLALLFYQLRDDQAALEYNQQAIHIAQELGDRRLLGQALTSLGDALAGLGRLDQAASAYQRAFDLRCELGQPHRAMASLAGLARVCLDQGDLAQAQARVEEISRYLETRALDDADEPFRVYLTCYHVLRANQDPRAGSILHTAHALLQERAARIKDEELRRSFLENVAAHREIVAAYHKLQTHPPTLQLTVSLPRASAPTGRPLRASEYVSVTWTVAAPGDDAIPKKKTRRQRRLLRLLKEAREQGAAPTVGDLAQALDVSQPTIRRDLAALRQAGHAPQTRGSRENAD